MTSRQGHKRRGAKFEIDIVAWLRSRGYDAERLRLTGKEDEGDVRVDDGEGVDVIEAKAPGAGNAIDLPGWLREAHTEAANYARARNLTAPPTPLVVIKARGKSLADAYVVQRLGDIYPDLTTSEDDR